MQAGKLDRLVTIERPTESQNARGEVVLGWPGTTFATLWGEKTPAGGGEGQTAKQQHAIGRYHWKFRYVPGVTADMRINENGVYADIVQVDETNRRQGELHVDVVERGA